MFKFVPSNEKKLRKSRRLREIKTLQAANNLLQTSPQILVPKKLSLLREKTGKPKFDLATDFDNDNYVQITDAEHTESENDGTFVIPQFNLEKNITVEDLIQKVDNSAKSDSSEIKSETSDEKISVDFNADQLIQEIESSDLESVGETPQIMCERGDQNMEDEINQRRNMRVKLPAFNKENPRSWVIAVNSLLALERGIDDVEKIRRFTNCLPDKLLTSFAPRIAETDYNFTAVTALLLAEFETNPSVAITRTLNQEFVGKKPSEILAELRMGLLLPPDATISVNDKALLKSIFYDKLKDEGIVTSLMSSSTPERSLTEEAKIADALFERQGDVSAFEKKIITTQPKAGTSRSLETELMTPLSTVLTSLQKSIQEQRREQNRNSENMSKMLRNLTINSSNISTGTTEQNNQRQTNAENQRGNIPVNRRSNSTSNQGMNNLLNVIDSRTDSNNWRGPQGNSTQNYQRTQASINYENRSRNDADVCYYHYLYGENAIKCLSWCRYNDAFTEGRAPQAVSTSGTSQTVAKNL